MLSRVNFQVIQITRDENNNISEQKVVSTGTSNADNTITFRPIGYKSAELGTELSRTYEYIVKEVRPDANIVTGRSGYGKRQPQDIGISAVRLGNEVGTHEVYIATQSQVITISHRAQSRSLFAEGAISAAEFLIGKPAGLYGMKDLVG